MQIIAKKLGALVSKGTIPAGSDLNGFVDNGIYSHGGTIKDLTNAPSDASFGFVIVMKAVYILQFIVDANNSVYVRGYYGYWTGWKNITT